MNSNKKKVALYGGTFSPPHIGHISVIEALIRLFPCDEIWILPSSDRHDKKASASGEHRIKMWKILIKKLFRNSEIPVKISKIELVRTTLTTTYGTKKELELKYPSHEFHFVVGSDLLKDIPNWVNGKKLLKEMSFVALKKPNVRPPDILPEKIKFINSVWTDVSSTFVRDLIMKGHSGIPYITPEIAEYIKKNKLYKFIC